MSWPVGCSTRWKWPMPWVPFQPPTDPSRDAALVIWLALFVMWAMWMLRDVHVTEQMKQKDMELGRLRGRLKSKDNNGTDLS
jgi:hypothetical protein